MESFGVNRYLKRVMGGRRIEDCLSHDRIGEVGPVHFGPGKIGPGQVLTFTLHTNNTSGGITQTNVFIDDAIPDSTSYVLGSPTSVIGVITPTYSTDGGNTYQASEPGDPASVTHLRWKRAEL